MAQSKKCPEFLEQCLWKRVVTLKYWVSELWEEYKKTVTHWNSEQLHLTLLSNNIKRNDENAGLGFRKSILINSTSAHSQINPVLYLCLNANLTEGKIVKRYILTKV